MTNEQLQAHLKSGAQAPKMRQGHIGMKLETGEQVLTQWGQLTTPFPNIKTEGNRQTTNTIKKVDRWLMQNALDAATSRGDRHNAHQFKAALDKPQQADKDSAEEYLFGDFKPPVVPSILKPLVSSPNTEV